MSASNLPAKPGNRTFSHALVTKRRFVHTLDQLTIRYDRKFVDLFKLQDEIALRTTIALQVKLTTGEEARMLSRTTNNVRAWAHYQKALSNFFKFSAEGSREARKFAEMALVEDPDFADAIIIIGFAHLVDARSGFSHSPGDSLSFAIYRRLVIRALGAHGHFRTFCAETIR